ncbi:MAG TPA: DUF1801 domain-containing protein [Thermoplasmata archaeon]|nr:DUF1801 domain-containing protein [Thermoplasmata archaeon]
MGAPSPSLLIDRYIASLRDWRGERVSQIRRLMHEADPEVVEEWKWMGTPTWSHDGVIAVATPMKAKVKITFSRGAHLPDPRRVFNNGLGGKEWRAIDIVETYQIDESAVRELVRAAVRFNRSEAADQPIAPRRAGSRPTRTATRARKG